MPLTQTDIFPVMQPDQWWAQTRTLGLVHILAIDQQVGPERCFEMEVWAPDELPGNKWHWNRGLGPPNESLLWFRSKVDVKHPIEKYRIGTVYISAVNHQLFFLAIIHGEVWILADWEVTDTDLQKSYVFQPAQKDPTELHDTRLERVLNEEHSPT